MKKKENKKKYNLMHYICFTKLTQLSWFSGSADSCNPIYILHSFVIKNLSASQDT